MRSFLSRVEGKFQPEYVRQVAFGHVRIVSQRIAAHTCTCVRKSMLALGHVLLIPLRLASCLHSGSLDTSP